MPLPAAADAVRSLVLRCCSASVRGPVLAGDQGKVALQGADMLLAVVPLPGCQRGQERDPDDDHHADADPQPGEHRADARCIDDHFCYPHNVYVVYMFIMYAEVNTVNSSNRGNGPEGPRRG